MGEGGQGNRRPGGLMLAALGAGMLAALAALPAAAQSWPAKPIRIIVPFPPGAFNDQLGRIEIGRAHV